MDEVTVVGTLAFGVGTAVYLGPWIVAERRGMNNRGPIIVIDVFLGWTLVGWVVALAMAVGGESRDQRGGQESIAPAASGSELPTTGSDVKTCPECAEQVKAAARICRFCRFEFEALK